MRRRVSFVLLAVLASMHPARAQPASIVSLDWNAPDTCPDAAYVRGEITRLLGAPSPLDKAVSARATVHLVGTKWRVALATESDESKGARSFEADSCRAA